MDIRFLRAEHDRRYNRVWWTVFLVGCCIAAELAIVSKGVSPEPWLVLSGLLGMILGRRRHHRDQAVRDAQEDAAQRQRAAARAKSQHEATGKSDASGQDGSANDSPKQ
ncbi:hypothetical protein [Aquincola sp. J276]|uniref:hypothetical protein n=1 Tax=Aquincola sp. J276 TaxID=2898432 RepID=UPI00215198A8|nr:hypothetical protein [Aquincola sp. J276]MCR5868149.1 hypothetical protein [Aquincola sp. J276]